MRRDVRLSVGRRPGGFGGTGGGVVCAGASLSPTFFRFLIRRSRTDCPLFFRLHLPIPPVLHSPLAPPPLSFGPGCFCAVHINECARVACWRSAGALHSLPPTLPDTHALSDSACYDFICNLTHICTPKIPPTTNTSRISMYARRRVERRPKGLGGRALWQYTQVHPFQ